MDASDEPVGPGHGPENGDLLPVGTESKCLVLEHARAPAEALLDPPTPPPLLQDGQCIGSVACPTEGHPGLLAVAEHEHVPTLRFLIDDCFLVCHTHGVPAEAPLFSEVNEAFVKHIPVRRDVLPVPWRLKHEALVLPPKRTDEIAGTDSPRRGAEPVATDHDAVRQQLGERGGCRATVRDDSGTASPARPDTANPDITPGPQNGFRSVCAVERITASR